MSGDCPSSRIVATLCGKVQGRRLVHDGDRQVDAFQGIPFAAPPIGELRFKKPQPPAAWEGVKETKKFAPRAIQVPFPGLPELMGPCLDGDFFPEPLDLLRTKAAPKPLLNGVTKEEGLFLMVGRRPTQEGLDESLQHATMFSAKQEEIKKDLRARFIGDVKPEDAECMRAQAGMIADAFFVAGHVQMCKKTVALQTEPIYLYVFEHFTGASILGFLGQFVPFQDVTHTNELFYLFKKGFFADPEVTETDRRLTNAFTTAFTNFAKYGNPNGPDDLVPVPWKPITKENPSLNYVFTSNQPKMSKDLFESRTAAFIEILNKNKIQISNL